jgi:hypothetical protein
MSLSVRNRKQYGAYKSLGPSGSKCCRKCASTSCLGATGPSSQVDHPARDAASAAAGDAGSMSEHTAMCRLANGMHGRWGDGRQPPSAERPTAESASTSYATQMSNDRTSIFLYSELTSRVTIITKVSLV